MADVPIPQMGENYTPHVRIRLLVAGIVVAVLCGAAVVVALVQRGDGPTEDCLRVERALKPWGQTMPDVYANLPADLGVDPREASDYAAAAAREAQAARDIRAAAGTVESADLRVRVIEVADALDRISRSRLAPYATSASPPAVPSKEFFAATNQMNESLHDIKRTCPDIAEPPPGVTPPR